ncbi:AI-2E family transporter [Salininema proteolyticum]|uniref:AI-2E family transporter n=1 Tax=Salininema proteolyticum TaxID=1607685 RepID=A0ABV8TXR5_9ACTN
MRDIWTGMRAGEQPSGAKPRVTVKELEEEVPEPPAKPSSPTKADDDSVPAGLKIGAAWSWRMIVIGAAAFAVLWFFTKITLVVIPFVIAFLLAAMFQPMAAWLIKHGWNRSLASILVLISGLAAVVGVLTFVVDQFIKGVPEFSDKTIEGIKSINEWLRSGPFGLDAEQVSVYLNDVEANLNDWVNQNQDTLAQGALDIGGSVLGSLVYTLTSFFLILFCTYFFLRDGRPIWEFVTGILPRNAVEPARYAGGAAWSSLSQYMRTMVIVALVDAVGIGIGLWILDVPLWLPLATLVFLGGFIPIVGATVSGAVAVLVALVAAPNGLWTALWVLLIVLAVQQIESNLLHPLLMSRAVKLHPLAIVLGVTAGAAIASIVGALIAVPILAVVNAFTRALSRYREAHKHDDEEEEDVISEGEESVSRDAEVAPEA